MIQTLTWVAAIWAIGAIPAYYLIKNEIKDSDEGVYRIVGHDLAAIIGALILSWVIVVMDLHNRIVDLIHRTKILFKWFVIRKTKRILRKIAKRPGMSDDIKQMIDKL